uniref:C-type lectin domain-containing protein n=1 Tax=Gopherus agassizii TaxID=38772 RepID=A0A452H1T6_9SAUR
MSLISPAMSNWCNTYLPLGPMHETCCTDILFFLACLLHLWFPIFIPGACSQENCLCARGFCNEGWVQYQDSCYKASMEPMKWPDAEVACQSYGKNSHLASIHSAEENDFIFHLMGKPLDYTKGQAYWIGAHDTFKEGSFMWTDGSKYNFRTFPAGQPDGLPGENYLGSWILQNGGSFVLGAGSRCLVAPFGQGWLIISTP